MEPFLDLDVARSEIVEAGARMYRFGLVVGLEGNLSARIGEDRVLTTPAGTCKGSLRGDELVVTDGNGVPVGRNEGARRPSTELAMHLAIYQERPDVRAVVHGHPPHATAFAVAGRELDLCLLPEIVVSLGSIPVSRYATPSTAEVAHAVRELVADHDAFLLRNHGAVCVGRTVMEAFHRLETVEALARVTLLAELLGGARALSPEQVQELLSIRGVYGIQRLPPACRTGGEAVGADQAAATPSGTAGGAAPGSGLDPRTLARIIAEEIARAQDGSTSAH